MEQALVLLRIVTHGVKCRTGIAAGSPVPIDLMQQLIEKLNLVDLSIAYGMSVFLFRLTETSSVDPQNSGNKASLLFPSGGLGLHSSY